MRKKVDPRAGDAEVRKVSLLGNDATFLTKKRNQSPTLTLDEHRRVDTALSRIRNRLIVAYVGRYKKVSPCHQRLTRAMKALVKLRAVLEGTCMRAYQVSAWTDRANDDAYADATVDALAEFLRRDVGAVIDDRVAVEVAALYQDARLALDGFRETQCDDPPWRRRR